MNVLEEVSDLPPHILNVPILRPAHGAEEAGNRRAIFVQVEAVADLVELHLAREERVLVSCGHGIERSPLAVVWYLYRKRGMDVSSAYGLVRQKRPQVQERLDWMHGPGWPDWW